MQTQSKFSVSKSKHLLFLSITLTELEPTSFIQASKFSHWKLTMAKGYNALIANGTWSLVPPYPLQHLVESEWVYRGKYHSHGSMERHKAHLVAPGFR